jgi:hypothetical protein
MATFNGTMSEPAREDSQISAYKFHIVEAIRKCGRPAEIAWHQIKFTQLPYRDHETYALLQEGMLSNLESDGGRGMARLQCIWRAQGRIDENSGVSPAYQIDLWIAEYTNRYVPLGKLVGLKWVSPVTIE